MANETCPVCTFAANWHHNGQIGVNAKRTNCNAIFRGGPYRFDVAG